MRGDLNELAKAAAQHFQAASPEGEEDKVIREELSWVVQKAHDRSVDPRINLKGR
jgi:hypothetical protein